MGIFDFFKGKKTSRVTFEGGPGDTVKRAIVIRGAPDPVVGVQSEYQYLARKFGRRGIDWSLEKQALLTPGDRVYDEMTIKLSDGTLRTVVFDITEFYAYY